MFTLHFSVLLLPKEMGMPEEFGANFNDFLTGLMIPTSLCAEIFQEFPHFANSPSSRKLLVGPTLVISALSTSASRGQLG